jgi:hypothetical protein
MMSQAVSSYTTLYGRTFLSSGVLFRGVVPSRPLWSPSHAPHNVRSVSYRLATFWSVDYSECESPYEFASPYLTTDAAN